MKRIGVLTYEIRHRKTYDALCLLRARGYQEVTVYGQKLHYQKNFQPLVSHRPGLCMDIPDLGELCRNLEYQYVQGMPQGNSPEEIYLLCGAGILEDRFVQTHRIINSHPGYLPLVRGLDAYKWAVYEGLPIGITTHILGRYVDAGEIIERKILEVSKYDTFHSMAQRVYENEIDMLIGAVEKMDEVHMFAAPGENVLHRRMPHTLEMELLDRFEMRKRSEDNGVSGPEGPIPGA